MPFRIIRNDITKIKADAIVNTANPEVAVGGGVDTAIYEAAGREDLLAARREIGPLPPGTAAVTDAFELDAKYIIHVSGPVWREVSASEETVEPERTKEALILRRCYDLALSLAWERDCKSIAFPLLATGACGFPKKLGTQIAVDAFTEFLTDHEMEITLAVFGREAVRVSGELLDEVLAEVDDEYVERALEEEGAEEAFRFESSPGPRGRPMESLPSERGLPLETPRLAGSISEGKSGPGGAWGQLCTRLRRPRGGPPAEKAVKSSSTPYAGAMPEESAPTESIDDLLKDIYQDSLEKHLQMLINKKGLKNSEVYAAANISKQYFSKLLKGKVKPSKEKMMALAVGLRLNLDESIDLLGMAGYAFSPISQTDTVVQYFIRRKDYNVLKIDIVLFDYGLDPLSG